MSCVSSGPRSCARIRFRSNGRSRWSATVADRGDVPGEVRARACRCRRDASWSVSRRSHGLHERHGRAAADDRAHARTLAGRRGPIAFVQVGAPSRTRIERYREFGDEVRSRGRSVQRSGSAVTAIEPVVLFDRHYEPPEVFRLYRAADVCYVSSLHDGMNLVAKEFISARDDERGVLVLSRFTGAARELTEALVVNPYDLERRRRHAARGADDVADRATRADASDALAGGGVQRLSLGRTHAARRNPLAPARAVSSPSRGPQRVVDSLERLDDRHTALRISTYSSGLRHRICWSRSITTAPLRRSSPLPTAPACVR